MQLTTFILTLAMSTFLMAADDARGDKTKMTGCLTKTTSGEYTLTDESGKKVTVTGAADLEKHSANHKVTLHGTQRTENGKTVFRVDRIEHVADSCVAPTAE
jgi:hypothetical protein